MGQLAESNDQAGFFSVEKISSIAVVRFFECPFYIGEDLQEKYLLHRCLDKISADETVKCVVFIGPPEQKGCERFMEACQQSSSGLDSNMALARLQSAVSQCIQKVARLNKFLIYIDQRESIPLYMNLGLACDYRVIREDARFNTRHLELGYVPNGGEVFFLTRIIGYQRALDTFFLSRELSAEEALLLDLVHETSARDQLEKTAFQMAERISEKPAHIISTLKSLMGAASDGLKASLLHEERICTFLANSGKFENTANCSF